MRLSNERLAELHDNACCDDPGCQRATHIRALVDEVKRLRAEVAELRQAEADWEAHDARECPGFQHCDVHCPGGEQWEML